MLLRLLLAILAAIGTLSVGHTHAAQHAHEHGAAVLNVVLEKKVLLINLDSPAANLVGFEHSPTTEAQREMVASAIESLSAWQTVFGIDAAAHCRLESIDTQTPLADLHEHSEMHSDEQGDDTHSDFEITWSFQCEDLSAITAISVNLFDMFEGFTEIDVNLVGPDGQTAMELNPGSSVIHP